MGSIQIAAAAEGLLVAEKAGLDLDLVAKALGMGSSGSPQVTRNSKLMVEAKHDKNVRFNAYWRLKDTRYGVKFADKMGQQTPLGKVAKKIFQELVNAGHGKLAESKVIDILRD
jgi:3-hydroxyisobutyrate dehydrogenase